jgi:hypothetical protein
MDSTSILALFPQELIDKIIERNGDDPITLRTSAVVCRSFLRSSQSCLFAHIGLGGAGPKPQDLSRRLYRVFLQSPHLCSYVRHLSLVVHPIRTRGGRISEDPSLIPVLSILHTLTSFTFKVGRDFGWKDLPKPLQMEICGLCRRSGRVKLALHSLRATDRLHFDSLRQRSERASPSLPACRL